MCKRFEDFDEESKQYNEILLKYLENGEVFVDRNFHPIKQISERNLTFDEFNTEWKRIDEIYPAPLFKKELINIDFVKQGELGDCFFLSALSYLSTQPETVPFLFDRRVELYLGREEDSINLKCGAVVVYFFAFGRRVPVLIDTFIPFSKSTQKPRFSRPIDSTKSAWFCLVEKAFAKLNESYTKIVGGTFSQAIYSLCGFYSTVKELSSLKSEVKSSIMQPFDRILKYLNQGAIISAGIHIEMLSDDLSESDLKEKGLVISHSYLLLSAQKVEGRNFLCLRNPWGEQVWNGDWSNDSDLWTPELKRALNFESISHGTFWMSDIDFLTYFTDIDVSKPIPETWHSHQFFYQLLPGESDGQLLESEEAKLSEKPSFAFQVTDPIEPGKNCRFHILVERRQTPEIESTTPKQEEDQNNNNNDNSFGDELDEKRPYCIILLSASGKKLEASDLPYCMRYEISTSSNTISFSYTVNSNEEVLTIVFHRLKKSSSVEDCYIKILCELDFKLYNIDEPENLIPEDAKIPSDVCPIAKKDTVNSEEDDKFIEISDLKQNDEAAISDMFLEEEEEDNDGAYNYEILDEGNEKNKTIKFNEINANEYNENEMNDDENSQKPNLNHISRRKSLILDENLFNSLYLNRNKQNQIENNEISNDFVNYDNQMKPNPQSSNQSAASSVFDRMEQEQKDQYEIIQQFEIEKEEEEAQNEIQNESHNEEQIEIQENEIRSESRKFTPHKYPRKKHRSSSPRKRTREMNAVERPPPIHATANLFSQKNKELQQRKNAYKKMNESFLAERKRKTSPVRQQQQQARSQRSEMSPDPNSRLRHRKSSPLKSVGEVKPSVKSESSPNHSPIATPKTVKQASTPKKNFNKRDIHKMFNSISDNVFASRFT